MKNESRWQEFIPKTVVCLRDNYNLGIFKKDLLSGITVGIVALPLAMAFAIASGVPPERGIYTAIIAGFLISLFGGSHAQIGGPTGAFVVIVYEIVQRNGYEGLVLATLIAAVLLIVMGLCRLGTWIKFIPYPLTTGFTSGIAVIIFSSQFKEFFGLKMEAVPADFLLKWHAYMKALPTWDPTTFAVAAGSLLLILLVRRFIPIIPWGIAAIVISTVVCSFFHLPVETIASRFGEITGSLPMPSLPPFTLSLEAIQKLIPDAITIALLAGIESLLSAVVVDGMTGAKHKSNCELIAQGIGNLGSCLFGGIPATGAFGRTTTNVKSGGKTPVAGMIHAITLFFIILFLGPIVSQIPLAALSAVLIMVAWNMCEVNIFCHLLKAPIGDIAVLLSAFFLTILVDLTVAVEVGMILAAFLFMKRMSDFSHIVPMTPFFKEEKEEFPDKHDPDAIGKKDVPVGVEVFEINGPFFFGVADSLRDVLLNLQFPPKVFILRMRRVPVLDATGMYALKEFYHKCKREGTVFVLSGVRGQPAHVIKKYGLENLLGAENIFPHIDAALQRSRELIK